MPLYKPTELRAFLDSLNIRPKKHLSQNFLIDGNIIRKIVDTAEIQDKDTILEIGPGPGALTEAILQKGAHLISIEKDPILAEHLSRLPFTNQFEILCEDFEEIDVVALMEQRLSHQKKAKVVANLPYHLTTPILSTLVPLHHIFSKLIIMVQEEVAQRFIAKPGTSDYSSFTVFLNFFSSPKYAFSVSKNSFYPVPKVDSAVVTIELKEPPNVNQDVFFKITRTAFGQRRKMLRSSLKSLFKPEQITEALLKCHLDELSRPEELSLDQWLLFFEHLHNL